MSKVQTGCFDVDVQSLRIHPMQPPQRLTHDAIKPLQDTITRTRDITRLVVDAVTRYVIDGNRRLTVCRNLDYLTVPCEFKVYDDINRAFLDLNRVMRRFNGQEWFSIYASKPTEDTLKSFPPATARHIRMLNDWLGKSEVVRIGKLGEYAANIAATALLVINKVGNYPSLTPVLRGDIVVYWLINHGMQDSAKHYVKHYEWNISKARTLHHAITHGKTV